MKRANTLKIIISIFVFCISALNILVAQWVPDNYYSIPAKDKILIFTDNFDNNNNSWAMGDNIINKGEMKDGYFYWQSLNDKAHTTTRTVNMNYDGDFEIESEIKYISGGSGTAGISLIFGKGDGCEYEIMFTGNSSKFQIDSYSSKSQKTTEIFPFTSSEHINKAGYHNKLTVRKVGRQWYFFINTKFVYTMDAPEVCGKKVGFMVPSYATIAISYISIHKLWPSGTLNPADYNAISQTKLSKVLYDDFNDNSNNWILKESENMTRTISNGIMYFESKSSSSYLVRKTLELDEKTDFQIETSIKFVKGDEINENCIIWGNGPENDYRFRYCITGDGYYVIDKYTGDFTDLIGFTKSSNVKTNDYNLLTIRKYGRTYYFFLNKTLIHEQKYEAFFGNEIGFQVGSSVGINIDFLKVSTIKK